jgi:hypothetical protein
LKHNDWSLEIPGLWFVLVCIIGEGIGVMLRDRCKEEKT